MLEPTYGEGVERELDEVESDDSRRALWTAICKTLDVIVDTPDSQEARKRRIDFRGGAHAWRVPVYAPQETEDWSVIWSPEGDEAVILYVGPWPPVN